MKIFTILFAFILTAATFTARAQSGDDGNIHWEIADGTLTISGTGGKAAMPNYNKSLKALWRQGCCANPKGSNIYRYG